MAHSPESRHLARLSQLLKILREAESVDDLIAAIAPYLKREMNYQFAWLGLYSDDSNCLVGHELFSPLDKRLMHRERISLESGNVLEQVFIQRRPLNLADLGETHGAGKWQTMARTIGIKGSLLFPIHCHERCYGVALLARQAWGMTPSNEEVATLSIVLGQMALALHHQADNQQQQRKKRPAEPLLKLLDELRTLPSLDGCLTRLVEETHHFIGASRASLYWLESRDRYFWRRFAQHSQGAASKPTADRLAVKDCPSLYQTLVRDRTLSVSDTTSAMQAEVSSYLQSNLQVRALLATPIYSPNGLLGFLATESLAPRLWTEEEKQYLQGVAQLATLIAPMGQIDQEISQGKADQHLVTNLGRATRNDQSWHDALLSTAEHLFARTGSQRLVLLDYDEAEDHFPIVQQHQSQKAKLLPSILPPLSELDWQLLQDHPQGFCLEDWQGDLRLMDWKGPLEEGGVRSFMVCPTNPYSPREGLMLLTHDHPYSWSGTEQELVCNVAQQLSMVMHQRASARQLQLLETLHQSLQWGLAAMLQERHPDRLDKVACQAVARLLQVPLVGLVSWSLKDGVGQLAASVSQDSQWQLPHDLRIDAQRDPLMQALVKEDNVVITDSEKLASNYPEWLSSLPHLDQLLLFPLRSKPGEAPQGCVFVGVEKRRNWPTESLNFATTLVVQLSGSRRTMRQLQALGDRQDVLQQLNWYKQYCTERFGGNLQRLLQRLQEGKSVDPALFQRMDGLLNLMAKVAQNERWELKTNIQTIPITRFLKQVKERIDGQVSHQQLWCQFHSTEAKQAQLKGDILKLEGIVHELLRGSCERCFKGGRIDVWCRLQPDNLIEIAVTDNGVLDPQLLNALQPTADSTDPLVEMMLSEGIGLGLSLARCLAEQLGASVEFIPLEDGRNMSRLLIPQP